MQESLLCTIKLHFDSHRISLSHICRLGGGTS